MQNLPKELNELVDAVRNRLSDESAVEQSVRIAYENADEDYGKARRIVSQFASDYASQLDIPWNLDIVVPMIAGVAIDRLKEYNGDVERLKQEFIRPIFAGFKEFGERGLAAIES
jgi:hypothetical protein